MNKKRRKENQTRKVTGKVLRLILLAVGAVAFLWFLVPFMAAGILNIGNVTGMILSVMLMCYMGFMPVIHAWFRKGWRKRKLKPVMALAGGLVFFCVLLVVIETGCMTRACLKTPTENATVVVLGCRVYGERASLMLVERLEAAYEYLEENPKAMCVVSGGQGSGENISEAECMYRYLVNKGIEPERIRKEEQSTSTEENINFSLEVIKENGWNERIVIATNEFHMYRAGVLAENNGLSYEAVPARTAAWLFPTYYVRELYAILAEWVL